MLKKFKLFAALIAALTALSGCHDEKELIVIDKNTPLKVSALYVMGDASAAGWIWVQVSKWTLCEAQTVCLHGRGG